MSQVIYKYPIPLLGHDEEYTFPLECQAGSDFQIVSAQFQDGEFVAWISHPIGPEGERQRLTLYYRWTGQPFVPSISEKHLATVQHPDSIILTLIYYIARLALHTRKLSYI